MILNTVISTNDSVVGLYRRALPEVAVLLTEPSYLADQRSQGMAGYCQVVEFQRRGSATRRATPSGFKFNGLSDWNQARLSSLVNKQVDMRLHSTVFAPINFILIFFIYSNILLNLT